MSQLDLAQEADVSQRHISFLEIERTAPSRHMALRLAAALDLPALGAPDLSVVDQALDFMLAQQEPYPAFVLDRRRNLLRANKAGRPLIRNWREVALYFIRGVRADALSDGTLTTGAGWRRRAARAPRRRRGAAAA